MAPAGRAVSGARAGGRGSLGRALKFGLEAPLGARLEGRRKPVTLSRSHPRAEGRAWVTHLPPDHAGALRLHPDCGAGVRGKSRARRVPEDPAALRAPPSPQRRRGRRGPLSPRLEA